MPARTRAGWILNFRLLLPLLFLVGPFALTTPRFTNFNTADGLSQSSCLTFLQDRLGYLWIGTQDGLNRFDGYDFKIYKNNPRLPNSLSANIVTQLAPSHDGSFWVSTVGGGLDHFDPVHEQFTHYLHDSADPKSIAYDAVWCVIEGRDGMIWAGTSKGLSRLDPSSGTFTNFTHEPNNPDSIQDNFINTLFQDKDGRTWVGTQKGGLSVQIPNSDRFRTWPSLKGQNGISTSFIKTIFQDRSGRLWVGTDQGLLYQGRDRNDFQVFPLNPGKSPDVSILCMMEDNDGYLWVGTRGNGLHRISPYRQEVNMYCNDPNINNGLVSDEVWSLLQDSRGGIWAGSRSGGFHYFDPNARLFELLDYPKKDKTDQSVWSILEDKHGIIWTGTIGSGINALNRKTGGLTNYRHDPNDPNSPGSDYIRYLFEDSNGRFWVCTDNAGYNIFNPDTQTFERHPFDLDDPMSPSGPQVRAVFEDHRGDLWFTTQRSGLNRLKKGDAKMTFYRRQPNNPNSLPGETLTMSMERSDHSIWISTIGTGVVRLDADRRIFETFSHDRKNPKSISNNSVLCLFEDSNNTLWVGTFGHGLDKMTAPGIFQHYLPEDGLPNGVIYGILEDDKGFLWMSTNNGLSRLDPEQETFRNFGLSDGLQSTEFNGGAYFKSARGEMFFGGINGVNNFFPAKVNRDPNPPFTVIQDMLLFNVPIRPGSPESPLSRTLEHTTQLTLDHTRDVLSFKFVGLHFSDPTRNSYAYRLLGFNNDWIQTNAENRLATYTDLDPGDYRFQVKSANKDGVWNETPTTLNLKVLPPPWKTWWAYTIYSLLLSAAVFAAVWQHRRKLAYERAVNDRLRAVDRLKDEFLANTSHELRTPLNGIIGLAESLVDGVAGHLPDQAVGNLEMIVSSGRRLSSLVNDILDFSQLRNHNLELRRRPVDLRGLAEVVLILTQPLLGNKELELINAVPTTFPALDADEDRLQQILHNLVGNAVKFTESGTIRINAIKQGDMAEISVADTGIGISPQHQAHIFESFEQAEGDIAREFGGTGLGLAVTRRLVNLHGGDIRVESTRGEGAVFIFSLPFSCESAEKYANPPANQAAPREMPVVIPDRNLTPTSDKEETLNPNFPTFNILIVDDEPINRQVLINHLSKRNYRLTQVGSGQEAIETLETHEPFDLILLDVMMPRMSGYEVCRRLRDRFSVSELPVIFLTARTRIDDVVSGFASGANDYLAKPVSKQELLSRVETHLELLDIHRHLEDKVAERTKDLEQKNEEILRTRDQMVVQEKMASLGTLTAGIAHEIKNPLNFVNNFAEAAVDLTDELNSFLIDGQDSEDITELVEELKSNAGFISKHGKRAIGIVESMMDYARGKASERQIAPINQMVSEFTDMAAFSTKDRLGLKVTKDLDPGVGQMNVSVQNLSRVIINLVNNAIDAAFEKEEQIPGFKPEVRITTKNMGDHVRIEVWDNGNGIPEALRAKIFTPFYSTKKGDRKNIGLGLAICYDIVTMEHGGRLEVDSEPGSHTRFTVCLPTDQ